MSSSEDFTCDLCPKRFTTQKGKNHHRTIVHLAVAQNCDWCDLPFVSRGALKLHKNSCKHRPSGSTGVTDTPLPQIGSEKAATAASYDISCRYCTNVYKSNQTLRAHISKVHSSVTRPTDKTESALVLLADTAASAALVPRSEKLILLDDTAAASEMAVDFQDLCTDVIRRIAYKNVIEQNRGLFKDKVVIDVGAGIGILSLFCAQVGAKHVYAVECSDSDMAEQIVEMNGYSDVITVLKGKVEELDLRVPRVDIIVSELMGYFSLYQSMFNKVFYARDKWLNDGGLVLPDKASLFLTAIEAADYKENKIEFWNSVCGFDMSCIRKEAIMEAIVDTVNQNQMVTNRQLLKTMDISKMTSGDASFTAPFKLVAERTDSIHALVAYFDVSFTHCRKLLMGFTTGPKSSNTHWKQTVFYLEDVLSIREGESVEGTMTVAQNKNNPRYIDITLKYSLKGSECSVSRTQFFRMR